MNAILIALLTAAMFYLGSRAKLTEPLWSRYPSAVASFMDCAACTGFWYGLLCAVNLTAWNPHMTYLGLSLDLWPNWFVVGLASVVTTPIAAGLMQRGLDTLGTAIAEPAEPERDWQELP